MMRVLVLALVLSSKTSYLTELRKDPKSEGERSLGCGQATVFGLNAEKLGLI
jgi:hypothetical protein